MLILTKAAPGMIPRKPSQTSFNAMLKARQADFDALIDQLAKGDLTPREWADAFDRVLLNGHTQAWMMGRQRAGNLEPFKLSDQMMGARIKDSEAGWLQKYLHDIEQGRYTDNEGNLKTGLMKNRANLYVGKMRGTASEAWAKSAPADMRVKWVLLALEHCMDCPEMARLTEEKEFLPGQLWAYPGSGDTECLGNCKCVLRLENGEESFRHPSVSADAPDMPVEAYEQAA